MWSLKQLNWKRGHFGGPEDMGFVDFLPRCFPSRFPKGYVLRDWLRSPLPPGKKKKGRKRLARLDETFWDSCSRGSFINPLSYYVPLYLPFAHLFTDACYLILEDLCWKMWCPWFWSTDISLELSVLTFWFKTDSFFMSGTFLIVSVVTV